MTLLGTPLWIWAGMAVIGAVVAVLAVALLLDVVARRPLKVVRRGGTRYEVWVGGSKPPRSAEAIIVPVSPDLSMAAGSAKWANLVGAGVPGREAALLPRGEPGRAYAVGGAKYRFRTTILAVALDATKCVHLETLAMAVANGVRLAHERGASTVLVPDMTDDLSRHPAWITSDERRDTCRAIAPAVIEGALGAAGEVETVVFWVRRPGTEDLFAAALAEAASSPISAPSVTQPA